MRLIEPHEAGFKVFPAEPLLTSPAPRGQNANDEVHKLTIHLADVCDERITVLCKPIVGDAGVPTPAINPLSTW